MAVARVKPRLRGVSHQVAFFASLIAGASLITAAPAGIARLSVSVFAASVAWLLGVSAVYHRPMWRQDIRVWLKRLDHASIFLLIAGTYTPLCLLVLQPQQGHPLLAFAWSGAVLGSVMALLWPNRPRILSAVVYVVFGSSALAYTGSIFAALDGVSFALFVLGGIVYICGAAVYAFRWPNPSPATFGYHEVFHLFVIVACAMHFTSVARVVGGLL